VEGLVAEELVRGPGGVRFRWLLELQGGQKKQETIFLYENGDSSNKNQGFNILMVAQLTLKSVKTGVN
jgi:hypothetical protein